MSGILPSAPDGDAMALKKRRMQQHYAQQLEQQMEERRRQKQVDKVSRLADADDLPPASSGGGGGGGGVESRGPSRLDDFASRYESLQEEKRRLVEGLRRKREDGVDGGGGSASLSFGRVVELPSSAAGGGDPTRGPMNARERARKYAQELGMMEPPNFGAAAAPRQRLHDDDGNGAAAPPHSSLADESAYRRRSSVGGRDDDRPPARRRILDDWVPDEPQPPPPPARRHGAGSDEPREMDWRGRDPRDARRRDEQPRRDHDNGRRFDDADMERTMVRPPPPPLPLRDERDDGRRRFEERDYQREPDRDRRMSRDYDRGSDWAPPRGGANGDGRDWDRGGGGDPRDYHNGAHSRDGAEWDRDRDRDRERERERGRGRDPYRDERPHSPPRARARPSHDRHEPESRSYASPAAAPAPPSASGASGGPSFARPAHVNWTSPSGVFSSSAAEAARAAAAADEKRRYAEALRRQVAEKEERKRAEKAEAEAAEERERLKLEDEARKAEDQLASLALQAAHARPNHSTPTPPPQSDRGRERESGGSARDAHRDRDRDRDRERERDRGGGPDRDRGRDRDYGRGRDSDRDDGGRASHRREPDHERAYSHERDRDRERGRPPQQQQQPRSARRPERRDQEAVETPPTVARSKPIDSDGKSDYQLEQERKRAAAVAAAVAAGLDPPQADGRAKQRRSEHERGGRSHSRDSPPQAQRPRNHDRTHSRSRSRSRSPLAAAYRELDRADLSSRGTAAHPDGGPAPVAGVLRALHERSHLGSGLVAPLDEDAGAAIRSHVVARALRQDLEAQQEDSHRRAAERTRQREEEDLAEERRLRAERADLDQRARYERALETTRGGQAPPPPPLAAFPAGASAAAAAASSASRSQPRSYSPSRYSEGGRGPASHRSADGAAPHPRRYDDPSDEHRSPQPRAHLRSQPPSHRLTTAAYGGHGQLSQSTVDLLHMEAAARARLQATTAALGLDERNGGASSSRQQQQARSHRGLEEGYDDVPAGGGGWRGSQSASFVSSPAPPPIMHDSPHLQYGHGDGGGGGFAGPPSPLRSLSPSRQGRAGAYAEAFLRTPPMSPARATTAAGAGFGASHSFEPAPRGIPTLPIGGGGGARGATRTSRYGGLEQSLRGSSAFQRVDQSVALGPGTLRGGGFGVGGGFFGGGELGIPEGHETPAGRDAGEGEDEDSAMVELQGSPVRDGSATPGGGGGGGGAGGGRGILRERSVFVFPDGRMRCTLRPATSAGGSGSAGAGSDGNGAAGGGFVSPPAALSNSALFSSTFAGGGVGSPPPGPAAAAAGRPSSAASSRSEPRTPRTPAPPVAAFSPSSTSTNALSRPGTMSSTGGAGPSSLESPPPAHATPMHPASSHRSHASTLAQRSPHDGPSSARSTPSAASSIASPSPPPFGQQPQQQQQHGHAQLYGQTVRSSSPGSMHHIHSPSASMLSMRSPAALMQSHFGLDGVAPPALPQLQLPLDRDDAEDYLSGSVQLDSPSPSASPSASSSASVLSPLARSGPRIRAQLAHTPAPATPNE